MFLVPPEETLHLNECLRSASGVNPNEDRVSPSFSCAQEMYQWQHKGKQGSLLWSLLRGFMNMLLRQTLLVTYLTAMVPPSRVNRNQFGLARTSSERLSSFLSPWGWISSVQVRYDHPILVCWWSLGVESWLRASSWDISRNMLRNSFPPINRELEK